MERSAQTLWILWGALIGSCLMLGGVAVLVAPEAAKGADPALVATMLPALASVAAAMLAISLFMGPMLARVTRQVQAYAIISWALAESAATMGLILALLGLAPATALIFVGAAVLAIGLQAPGEGFMARYAKYRDGR